MRAADRPTPAIFIETNGRTDYSCEIGLHDRVTIGGVEHRVTIGAHRDTIAEAAADFRALVAEAPSILEALRASKTSSAKHVAARRIVAAAARALDEKAYIEAARVLRSMSDEIAAATEEV